MRVNRRGFALAIFLMLMPIIALMAWTYLKVGSATRAQAVAEEREIRALQAAEAGVRRYLFTGETKEFEMNDCRVTVTTLDSSLIFRALPAGSRRSLSITLQTSQGYVVGRTTNEET